jgi:hypothetical protein
METDEIISLFSAIEKQVQDLEYGTISGNVLISKGLPVSQTLNLVISKRKRYKVKGGEDGNT